ncbi:MAG: hypothetical protein PF447_11610 [Spirochaetaceae bacterium]|jgi:alpha-tubulin suppressor-like RCC1 family protein|nr:hypothetical protein [Spirochaetaceae bacterium]
MGIGTIFEKTSTPQEIKTDIPWEDIAPGFFHCLGLKEDGSLWVWGSNEYEALGIGTARYEELEQIDRDWSSTVSSIPIRIDDSNDWLKIESKGDESSMALKKDGSVWVWGANLYEHKDEGTSAPPFEIPTQVIFPENPEANFDF